MSEESLAREGSRRRKLRRLALAALLTLLACALAITYVGLNVTGRDPRLLQYQHQTVDAVHVTRAQLERNGVMAPLNRTAINAHAAQALYDAAFALPVFPRPMNCPLGPDVVYHLAFSHGGAAVLTDYVYLDGCCEVSLGDMSSRMCDEQFLGELAQTLGVSVDSIANPITHPTAAPSATLTGKRAGPSLARRASLVMYR